MGHHDLRLSLQHVRELTPRIPSADYCRYVVAVVFSFFFGDDPEISLSTGIDYLRSLNFFDGETRKVMTSSDAQPILNNF